MNGQLGKTARFIKLAIAATLLLSACSNKKDATTNTSTGYTTGNYTSDYGTSTISPTYNANLFDTSIATDTPAVATNASTTYVPINTVQQNCLTGGYNWWNLGSTQNWYGTGTGTLSNNCYNSGLGGSLGQDMFYDLTLQSFSSMQQCSDYVMSQGPQLCTAGVNVDVAFQMSEMALVRCFRQILKAQMQAVRWSQDQTNSYNANDNLLYDLLKKLVAGN